jgi:hypothetical protein
MGIDRKRGDYFTDLPNAQELVALNAHLFYLNLYALVSAYASTASRATFLATKAPSGRLC